MPLVPLLLALAPWAAPQDDTLQAEIRALRAVPLPELSDEDVPRWRALVEPSEEERAFETIPWLASFAEGLRAAEAAGKPLLFWAMNGHPLGCT